MFITAPSDESLNKPLTLEKSQYLSKPRSSSTRGSGRLSSLSTEVDFLADLQVENMLSSKVRSSSNSDVRTIKQHLHQLESSSRVSSVNMVVGMRDYDPSGGAMGQEMGVVQWENLEMQAAVGMRGALQENFVQSVQVMDHLTDNSKMPFTVVKGKCVRVFSMYVHILYIAALRMDMVLSGKTFSPSSHDFLLCFRECWCRCCDEEPSQGSPPPPHQRLSGVGCHAHD